MTGLTIDTPGPRTTVQDLGRRGYQHQGLSPGGAADIRSFRWANRLVDNQPVAACLEITLGGLRATATGSLLLALTGADCRATVNGRPVDNWSVFAMGAGDRLQLETPRVGVLTYLAVAGGWQTRCFCDSRSAIVREAFRGLGAIEAGQNLPASRTSLAEHNWHGYLGRYVPPHLRPPLESDAPLQVMPGPEFNTFPSLDRARFIHGCYTIGAQSDRMGYRLEGPALPSSGGITSRAVCCGTVQIPGDGKPMVLLNDRQTIGGYPVLGVVPLLDCAQLAQRRPGEQVKFRWADVADCQSQRLLFERLYEQTVWTNEGKFIDGA